MIWYICPSLVINVGVKSLYIPPNWVWSHQSLDLTPTGLKLIWIQSRLKSGSYDWSLPLCYERVSYSEDLLQVSGWAAVCCERSAAADRLEDTDVFMCVFGCWISGAPAAAALKWTEWSPSDGRWNVPASNTLQVSVTAPNILYWGQRRLILHWRGEWSRSRYI